MKTAQPWAAVAVALALFAPAAASAQTGEDIMKPGRLLGVDLTRTDEVTRAQAKYAKGVASEMVCLCGTCPKESLATCDCSWASRGRRTIQLALLDGKTDADVLDAFRKSFGDKVFAAPPSGVTTMVTAVSFGVGVLMLMGMVIFGLRNQRRMAPVPAPARRPETTATEDEAARILRRELEELD